MRGTALEHLADDSEMMEQIQRLENSPECQTSRDEDEEEREESKSPVDPSKLSAGNAEQVVSREENAVLAAECLKSALEEDEGGSESSSQYLVGE